MTVDLKQLTERFFTDPDWAMMEELIASYITPLKDLSDLDTKRSNDEIAADIRGRQIAVDCLEKFLGDTKIFTRRTLQEKTSFK